MNQVVQNIESALDRIRARSRPWVCVVCGTTIIGPRDLKDICSQRCAEARHVASWKKASKRFVLAAAKVPELYRGSFDASYHGPICDRRMPDLEVMDWRGKPWSMTILGVNGSGKSMLAAEILYRLRDQARTMAWVRPAQLIAEDRSSPLGVPRPLFSSACAAQALVIDELGHGHQGDHGVELLAEIFELRWSTKRPTIVTTHLHRFGEEGGSPSVQEMSNAIADRLSDGLVVGLTKESRRGI